MVVDAGESFSAPGGRTFTGRWDGESLDVSDVRTNSAAVVAPYEDIKDLQIDDTIWRLSKNLCFTIVDIVPDEREGFSRLILESA